MKVAVLQAHAEPGAVERNLDRITEGAAQASRSGARLLVTPELFATGYAPTTAAAAAPPDLRERLAAIAAGAGIALVASIPDAAHITAQVTDRDGTTSAVYRKTHLYGPDENAAFRRGDGTPVVGEVDGVRVGLLVCYDVEFPEAVRTVALAGADLLAVPTANMEPYTGVPRVLLPARSLESQLYLAYANHVGEQPGLDFRGGSLITGPDGAILAQAGSEEEILTADVDLEALAASRATYPYLTDRVPGAYA